MQDIYPKAVSLLINIPDLILSTLQTIDIWVLNNVFHVVTLTEDIRVSLKAREIKRDNITLVENPLIVSGAIKYRVLCFQEMLAVFS